MPRTLYAKLALGLVLLFTSMGLIYAVVSVSSTRHYLREVNQQLNRDLARNLVADRNLVEEGRINQAMLEQTFQEYMVINPSIEIYLLDLDGKILSFSADPAKVKRRNVSLEPIKRFLEEDTLTLGDDPRSHDRRKAFSVTPVPSAKEPEGYLYVVLRSEQYEAATQAIESGYFFRLSSWAVAGSLVFGLLAGLVVFRILTRRLKHLALLMEDFQADDFRMHTPYGKSSKKAADEIDQLGETFDKMATRIVEQFDELKEKETVRRELVAHVSHDLRTPLASLHGYLETMKLKTTTLSEQEREEYLDIALRHSERLTRLVEDLFELAKLDAKEAAPCREAFSLDELAQDVVQKFKLQARERGVGLHVHRGGTVPLAYAEIALIERVLENLVENALDHTPKGGSVSLELEREGDTIVTRVADTGCGIPEAELPKIFDRFYQAGGEHRGTGHAGLGLAIAKRILALHGSRIGVTSAVGRGTVFMFALPMWDSTAAMGVATGADRSGQP